MSARSADISAWSVGLPLTSSFLLEYSSEYLNEYSSLVNTGSTLIYAGNDEEGGVEMVVSVNIVTGSIARSAKRPYLINSSADFEVFRPPQGRHVAPMGSETVADCKNCNRKWKFATGIKN